MLSYLCNIFQFRLQAAGQDGEAVTEILFWDGPEKGIATYKYQPEAEFVNCDCCFVDPVPQVSVTGTKTCSHIEVKSQTFIYQMSSIPGTIYFTFREFYIY